MTRRSSILWFAATAAIVCLSGAQGAQAKATPRKKGSADRVKIERPEPVTVDAAAINNPATQDPVAPDSAGSSVVRAQILLDQAHFLPGEIDGRYGDNLRVAILGFQAARKLPVSGVVDEATWRTLNMDAAPVLTPYTVSPVDAVGPYQQIPSGVMEQSQLQTLGYQWPGEALGERFHVQPKLLEALNPGKDFGKAGEILQVPNVQRPYGVVQADRIVVSKSRRTVEAFAPDGTLLAQYPATTGSEHDPLPIGDWKITVVKQNPEFYYNPDLFWNADPKDSKAKIAAGPNNPVGVVWIGLSREHYGIHGTPEPGMIGHAESHGCIRLTNWDAEELSRMVKPGTPLTLQE
jgi:lipoprotein-anchoring transpeptidase ErfK/SrfK